MVHNIVVIPKKFLLEYDPVKHGMSKIPKGDKVELVLHLESSVYQHLKKCETDKSKISFMKQKSFENGVIAFCYLSHCGKRCVITDYTVKGVLYLIDFLSSIKGKTYWISIELDNSEIHSFSKALIDKGFHSPEITEVDPCERKISTSISFIRDDFGRIDKEKTLNKFSYIVKQYSEIKECNGDVECSVCKMEIKLSSNAYDFLKQSSKPTKHSKNGNNSQTEIGGSLYVSDIEKEGGTYIFHIKVDRKSIVSGSEEDIKISSTRYNFHSHPEEAYERHGVDKAWPSVTDYFGYLTLGNDTICHLVATLEGLYVLSFGPYWVNNLAKVSKKFIRKNYNISYGEDYSPSEYVEKVNKILYKKHPIYVVKYLTWDEAKNPFSVSYAQGDGGNCVV